MDLAVTAALAFRKQNGKREKSCNTRIVEWNTKHFFFLFELRLMLFGLRDDSATGSFIVQGFVLGANSAMGLHPMLLLRNVHVGRIGAEHGVPGSNQGRAAIAQRGTRLVGKHGDRRGMVIGRVVGFGVAVAVGVRVSVGVFWEPSPDSIKHHPDLVLVSIKDVLDGVAFCRDTDAVHELEGCQ